MAESCPRPSYPEDFLLKRGLGHQSHMHALTHPGTHMNNTPNSQVEVLEPNPFLRLCSAPTPRAKDVWVQFQLCLFCDLGQLTFHFSYGNRANNTHLL